ncbi:MAG: RecB family exonuclease [Candidatus Saccharicenans sp.]|uniref:RecB family exonuclease n=1 Tax=Candidatus Saccharicenans sp. TaxID=2819258 RepID=UPI0040495E72
MKYSSSKLSTYETCPWKFKLTYIDRLEVEEEGIEAFLGNRFHETMEKLYSEHRFRIMTLDEVRAYFEEQWKKHFHQKVIIVPPERTADDYFRLGLKYIEDYYRHYHPFNQNRVLGLEQFIEIELEGQRQYILQGYVDRVDLTPEGVLEIHDYKTSSSLPSQAQADADRQLALYQLGIKKKWPWAEKFRLVWHYVAFDLEISSTRTPENLEELKREIVELIEKIESDREFTPKESVLCNWCAFREYCPLKKHEASLAKLPANAYLGEEGVVLVNKYIEYLYQKKEAETELEKLKEAIIRYAEKNNISRVMGSEFHVTLSKQERIKIPGAGKEKRVLLENLIRQAGLWDKLSSLDRFALEKAIKTRQLEEQLLQKLSGLISKEIQVTLYPGKNESPSD